jgi:hypothetical protein
VCTHQANQNNDARGSQTYGPAIYYFSLHYIAPTSARSEGSICFLIDPFGTFWNFAQVAHLPNRPPLDASIFYSTCCRRIGLFGMDRLTIPGIVIASAI